MNLLTSRFSSAVFEAAQQFHADGLARPRPRIANMERRQSARYVADLSRRVSVAEMEVLSHATQLREEALVSARQKDTAQARALLQKAAGVVRDGVESREGQISAASFHGAAAGFVEHVAGDHRAAMKEMLSALRHCKTLRLEFGHGVEMRRIHLARNVARLVWSLGRHADAVALCDALIRYTWDGDAPWPVKGDTAVDARPHDRLRTDERVFLTDQLSSETVSTCANARAQDQSFDLSADVRFGPDVGSFPERAVAARQFCAAMLGAEADTLVQAAAVYFQGGPCDLPMTWGSITRLIEGEVGQPLTD